jgi:hypothetical protein
MRHSSQPNQSGQTHAATSDPTLATLTELLVQRPQAPGRHRAAVPAIPVQMLPSHDELAAGAPEVAAEVVPRSAPRTAPETATAEATGTEPPPAHAIPETARWKASHLSRTIAGVLLGLSLVGTAVLAFRFEGSRSSDDFVVLSIAGTVVVALWGLLIASTPQVVTLYGSLLTIHNSGGHERFDLADGLQPLDLVGDPRSREWALLLHRGDRSSVVLRRHDVVATELDPIVRHYRAIAERRVIEREARFNS